MAEMMHFGAMFKLRKRLTEDDIAKGDTQETDLLLLIIILKSIFYKEFPN